MRCFVLFFKTSFCNYGFLQASGNVVCKSETKPKELDESLKENFDAKDKDDVGEPFPTPPQVSMCSPPMSVTGEDDDTSYPLMHQFSQNSSPMFSSPEEVCMVLNFYICFSNCFLFHCVNKSLCCWTIMLTKY